MFRKNCKDTSSTLPLQDASSDISTYGYIWPFKVGLSSSEKFCCIGFNENSLKMMIMNCFCGMVDQRKAFSLIYSRDHCQRSLSLRILTITICHHPDHREQDLNLHRTWVQALLNETLCSTDSLYTTALKMLFTSSKKLFSFSRYLNFCSEFFGHPGNRCDKKVKFNFRCHNQNLWRRKLRSKQLQ